MESTPQRHGPEHAHGAASQPSAGAEKLPPDTCKFVVSRTVHSGGPFFFANREDAAGSPLAERLFSRTGVISVLVAENVVTVLFIAMSGGCQGCAASQITLRQSFEVMVRRVAPEIVDIVDTTDHASGTKPFYQRTGEDRG